MKKCSEGIKILAVIYVAVILFIIAATAVEAKEPTFKSLYVPEGEWHNGGHLFIVKGGLYRPAGQLTTDTCITATRPHLKNIPSER